MKKNKTFLGILLFLLCGMSPFLQAQLSTNNIKKCAVYQDNTIGSLTLYNTIVYQDASFTNLLRTDACNNADTITYKNLINKNPLFPAKTDYCITSNSSPAFNSGSEIKISTNNQIDSTNTVRYDIKGDVRKKDIIDIGAFEIMASSVIIPTSNIVFPAILNDRVAVYHPKYDNSSELKLYNSIIYNNSCKKGADSTVNASSLIDVYPSFTSRVDYSISTSLSAAYNRGTANFVAAYQTDIKGNARVQGISVEIGAYEVGWSLPTRFGSYFRTVKSGNWNDLSIWEFSTDGENWSPATTLPNLNLESVYIPNDQEITVKSNDNVAISNLTIAKDGKLTIEDKGELTVISITLESDSTGNGTVVDKNLNGNGISSSISYVQQYLSAGRTWYVSSPVSNATTAALNTATSVWNYYEPVNLWLPVKDSTQMNVMQGYVAKDTKTSEIVTFSGTYLNSGYQSMYLTRTESVGRYKGFNLVGNPYPSYVNWQLTTKNNLLPTVWYRTKGVNSLYVFETYNDSTNIGTNNSGNGNINSYIAPIQGFWVRVRPGVTNGRLTFDNTMRFHKNSVPKPNTLKAPSAVESNKPLQQVVRLRITDGTSNDESILVFNANSTTGLDNYDSQKMQNEDLIPELYTLIDGEKMVINSTPKLILNKELPLGISTTKATTLSIKATEFTNLDADTKVILKDKLLNIEQELTPTSSYNFSSGVTSGSDRFSIIFRKDATNQTSADNDICVYRTTENRIVVNCKGDLSSNASVSVFNSLGQKITSVPMSTNNIVIKSIVSSGVYVVTVTNGEKHTTKKVTLN